MPIIHFNTIQWATYYYLHFKDKKKKWGWIELSNFCKATELVNSTTKIWPHVCLTKPSFFCTMLHGRFLSLFRGRNNGSCLGRWGGQSGKSGGRGAITIGQRWSGCCVRRKMRKGIVVKVEVSGKEKMNSQDALMEWDCSGLHVWVKVERKGGFRCFQRFKPSPWMWGR